jgi:hypothetical protein
MTADLETHYSLIGRLVLDEIGWAAQKALLYSEVEDGVVSADIFYLDDKGAVIFRFGSDRISDEVFSFWQDWKTEPTLQEWRAMSYSIDGDHFSVDLTYPDALIEGEGVSERRPRAVRKFFGDVKVDYSHPKE